LKEGFSVVLCRFAPFFRRFPLIFNLSMMSFLSRFFCGLRLQFGTSFGELNYKKTASILLKAVSFGCCL
jgi:hypothetical protein